MTLADKIVEYRAKHNLSQRAFADLCKLSSVTITSIERGTQEPSRLTAMKIEIVLRGEQL